MKNITLLILFVLASCSKPSSGPTQKFGQISENVIHYEEINMAFTNGVITAGSTFNYGDIPTGTTVTHDIVISNSSSAPLANIVVNSNTAGLTYTIVPGAGAVCTALARGKKCTIKVKYVAPATVPTPNPIVEEIVINNSSVAISGNVIPAVTPVPPLSVPVLDLGTFTGNELSSTFQILNQDLNTIPLPGLIFDLTGINADFTLDYSDCQRAIASRAKCNLTISYMTADLISGPASTTFKIFDKTYTINVIKDVPDVDKFPLVNFNPSSGLVDFGDKKQEDGDTANKVMRIKNMSGKTQAFVVPPVLANFILVSNGCTSVANRGYCNITLKFNSNGKQIQEYTETFLMENDKYKIEFDLRANVIANSEIVFCDLTNSVAGGGINNANNAVTAVEGIFPLCTVKTCQPTYAAAIDLKSCQPTVVACTVTDATNNGVVVANSNSTVKGDVIMGDISACLLADTACNLNYSRNVSGKSCDPIAFACTTLDATANGVNFTNSNSTVQGTVLAGDVSACLLANTACNLNYVRNASGKICDGEIRACTQADAVANGVNVQNVNLLSVPPFLGNVNTGDVSACLINSCITGYTKNGAGKLCLQDSRACIASDITGLGGSITNALTYSGNVILNDPAACRIATCSGAFEPTTNGLACESKAMSNLTFTITNKNANGYIKDSFAQLAINTVNALEMKISDNNNCTAGTFEPFSASKQFTIPAGRLNGSVDVPLSIQFRRNATTSACIYVSGVISLATSHNYRHDNIAPTPLTITTYTENQNITAASVTFGGACFTGVTRETGLSGQTLNPVMCSGAAYTSQSIATATDGNYALYVRQVDLAGNLSEVTRNVRKITNCTLGNATSGGVRSTYGAIGVTGNLTDGCSITSCQTYTTIAGDSKECVPKTIASGSFLITKNANGYINTSTVALTSIVATNAQTFDIFENADCSSTAKVSDRTMTTSTTFTPSVYNSTDQAVSIKFKNGSAFLCVHVAGAITVPSANTYRHDNMAPSPLTLTTTLIGNGQTITSSGITSVTFTGTCDIGSPLVVGIQGSETPTTCSGGTYSKLISPTFATDTTYPFRASQTDLAGNTTQQSYTIIRNVKKLVTVNRLGLGTGTVIANTGGLTCPGNCSVYYAPMTITLTATPDSVTSTLTGWSVTGHTATTCTGTTNPCTVTIGSATDVVINATFGLKPTYALTVTKAGLGVGTVTSTSTTGINCGSDCTEPYYQNQSITLLATPDANSVFVSWTGACTGSSTTCIVAMGTAVKSVTATFRAKVNYSITITKSGAGDGSIASSPVGINCGSTCSYSFLEGTIVTLTSTPDSYSLQSTWGGDCTGILDSGTCELSVTANKTVTKAFTAKPISPTDVGAIVVTDTNDVVYAVLGKNKTSLSGVGGLFYNKLTSTELSSGFYWSDYYRISSTEFLISKRAATGYYGVTHHPYLVNTTTGVFTHLNYGNYHFGFHSYLGEIGNYVYTMYRQDSNSGGSPYLSYYAFNKITKTLDPAGAGNSYSHEGFCRKVGANGILVCISPGSDTFSAFGSYRKDGIAYNLTLYPNKYLGIGTHAIGSKIHVYNDKMYLFSRYGEGKIISSTGTFTTFTISDGTTATYSDHLMYKNYILYWAGSQLKARNMDNISQVSTVYSGTGSPAYQGFAKSAKLDMIKFVVGSTQGTITNATASLSAGTYSVNTTTNYYASQLQAACSLNKLAWDYDNCWQYLSAMYVEQVGTQFVPGYGDVPIEEFRMFTDPYSLLTMSPAYNNPSQAYSEGYNLHFDNQYLQFSFEIGYNNFVNFIGKYNETTKKYDLIVRGKNNYFSMFPLKGYVPLNDDSP